MEKRRIGSLEVTVVGLGTNNFGGRLDAAMSAAVVGAALDAGINFFDTADIYGGTQSEEYLGAAVAKRRDEVVLATKFGMAVDEQRRGASPAYIHRAVEDSLRRLGTDRIDLYQLHTPDPSVPIADTLGALSELIRAGKVREIGASNFSVEQLSEAETAAKSAGARFVSVQNEYSVLHREPERAGVLAECRRRGLAFVPYFPLASGVLSGKYRAGAPPPSGSRLAQGGRLAERFLTSRNVEAAKALRAFAEERGHTLLELAISWLLARSPVASVIAGATTPDQVRANAGAVGWKLTADDLAKVDRLAAA